MEFFIFFTIETLNVFLRDKNKITIVEAKKIKDKKEFAKYNFSKNDFMKNNFQKNVFTKNNLQRKN